MHPIFAFMLSYMAVVLVFFLLFNFLTSGFLGAYIRVKTSQGKRALIFLRTMTGIKFITGTLKSGLLRYKFAGEKKSLTLPESCVKRIGSVSGVFVHGELNAALDEDWDGVEGFDAEMFDNLLTRALTLPEIQVDKKELAILVLCLFTLLAVIYVAFTLNETKGLVETVLNSFAGVIN